MQYKLQNNGFSLTEVMMAAGILAIGFAFIAGMFPVGVKLTAITTEQTIAPIVVDEAIAKMRLYGDPNFLSAIALYQANPLSPTEYIDFADVCYIPDYEFIYPSIYPPYPPADISPDRSQYHWSALCRPDTFSNEVHVIVFVSRRAGAGAQYLTHEFNWNSPNYGQGVLISDQDDWPVPVGVGVTASGAVGELTIDPDDETYINAGSTIVDDATGQIYRVLGRGMNGDPENVITLDRNWEGPATGFVWVVPPAVTDTGPPPRVGGRYPCVRVDPTHTIRF